jgi:hypothetical protein
MICSFSRDLHARSFDVWSVLSTGTFSSGASPIDTSFFSGMDVAVAVDVVKVVVLEGCCEASNSSLMCARQRISPSGVASPPACSLAPLRRCS